MSTSVPALSGPRLPYHPAIEERFGVDKAAWKALVEAVFPAAKSAESVILALSYCKARNLDVFKRVIHIVPIWDSQKGSMVDTVWPGIGELRTTAFRTGAYAGMDETKFGPECTQSWAYKPKKGPERLIKVTFPQWCQVTVYRMVQGQRVPFPGPRVYWLETYARMGKSPAPNSMWETRPMGQIAKCAEAAALRAAFPEEIGDSYSAEETRAIEDAHNASGIRDAQAEVASDEPELSPKLPAKGLDELADSLSSKDARYGAEQDTMPAERSGEVPDTMTAAGDEPLQESFFDEDPTLETEQGL